MCAMYRDVKTRSLMVARLYHVNTSGDQNVRGK